MRVIINVKNSDTYFANTEADEMHEDGKFLKAYLHNELVAMALIEDIELAYMSGGNNAVTN